MLKIISGQFHPGLENEFLTHISNQKRDALTPLLVVTPTSRLKEHLERILSKSGLSTLQTHLIPLATLAENVATEEKPLPKPILSDPLFYDTLVKQILKDGRSFPEMADMAIPSGFPPAVRATLRDLIEAGINEDNVEEAIREEFLGKPVDLGSLRSLLNLYRSYLKKLRSLPVYPRSEIMLQATEFAPHSAYLRSFSDISFYGFYDMTGLQFDFFEALAKHHPTTFFFPYNQHHPAYTFSKRFRDNFLQQISHEAVFLDEEKTTDQTTKPEPHVISVSGFHDEAMTIATHMVRLHEDENIPYSNMAVIARNEDRLKEALPRILRDFLIPFRSSFKDSIREKPQVQMALQLLELTDHDIVSKGDTDFMRHRDFKRSKSSAEFAPPRDWPEADSWSNYVNRTRKLLGDHFDVSNPASKSLWDFLFSNLATLADFKILSPVVSRREFLDTLSEKWNRLESNTTKNAYGVSLLHAEAARGLSFQVIFLIGLEEKVFPRLIREDPFLRDDARFALNATLGHKIAQKATALEEERLLFQLFLDAAQKKLFLFHRRSDEEGHVVGTSPFLRAWAEQNNWNLKEKTISVPRPLLSKVKSASPTILSYETTLLGFLSAEKTEDALAFAKACGRNSDQLKFQLECRDALQQFDRPGAYDGLIGKKPDTLLFKRGVVSPTTLEIYGRCGFQFFSRIVLGLEAIDDALIQEKMEAHLKGTAVHNFLETYYKAVTNNGKKPLPSEWPDAIFEKTFQEKIESLNSQELNLHPIVWEAEKISLKEKLLRFLQEDLRFSQNTGFTPLYLENEFLGSLKEIDAATTWKGRMDRVDKNLDEIRVIDYKTGYFSDNRRVALDALRGQKLQAPLYLLMMEELLKGDSSAKKFSFHYLYPMEEDNACLELSAEDWANHRSRILKTIRTQLEWIRSGHFLMQPDEPQCTWCDVAQACRKNHGVSIFRSTQGEGKKFWDLREAKE